MKFSAVRGRVGGRGGVIAGAPVLSSIPQPISISIELAPGTKCGGSGKQPKGMVLLKTVNDVYFYKGVSCDVLIASRQLIYDEIGVAKWVPGDAIGLASIDTAGLTKTFPLFIPVGAEPLEMGRRHAMLLHPGLVDLDIGRSVGFLDLWPGAPVLIAKATNNAPSVVKWLKSTRDAVTWKWSDSASEILLNKKNLVVKPIKRNFMLSMRIFSEKDTLGEALVSNPDALEQLKKLQLKCNHAPTKETRRCKDILMISKQIASLGTQTGVVKEFGHESTLLDQASYEMIKNVPDFGRVEELLKTLAIFRWAKTSGAKFIGNNTPLESDRAKTPDSIIVSFLADSLAGADGARSWKDECEITMERLQKAKKMLISSTDSFQRTKRELVFEFAIRLLVESNTLTVSDSGKIAYSCSH